MLRAFLPRMLLFTLAPLAWGCSAPVTRVEFRAPAGSTMTLAGHQYQLPSIVPLKRPRQTGHSRKSDVSFTFANVDNQTISAEGIIEIFGYDQTDLDRLATNVCEMPPAELAKLTDGFAVVFDGTSASKQSLYHLIIGKPK